MRRHHHVASFKHLLLISLSVLFLLSCSSQKQTRKTAPVKEAPIVNNDITSTVTAKGLLQQASQADSEQAIALMISASEQYSLEQNELKALWLANQITPLTESSAQLYQLALIKAQAFFSFNDVTQSIQWLDVAKTLATKKNITHKTNYFQLLSQVRTAQGLALAGVDAKLRAFSLNNQANAEDVMELWQSLIKLSQWEVNQLTLMNPPYVKGWRQLLTTAHQFGDNDEKLSRGLVQWQRRNPSHPANQILSGLSERQAASLTKPQKIAILLPLTGKQAAAGKSAQQGILAAFDREPLKTLHFIDTNSQPIESLPTIFSEQLIDYAIGPLLKQNVEKYVAQDILVPTLLLNIPSQAEIPEQHSALSMRREDEAVQAATTLSQQSFKHPVVLSLTDNTSRRIAKAFVQRWQLINNQEPEVVYLESGSNMQNTLKLTLDVDKSQARIKEIERRVRQNIESESRNRRDIDMIYVIGSPRDTRLLKPYIDVNISPFANLIPVYASSLSHSARVDDSEIRDLQGLTFTEMPWLLDSKQQHGQLAQRSEKLWPTRSDSLQRIFAMGYDSLALIDKIPTMKQYPYVRHFGQTGTLKLDANHILTRSLLWGKYTKRQVKEIAME